MLALNEARRLVRTDAGAVSFLDVGEGPPALFVHGVGTNAYLWRNVIREVSGHRRCIAVDLPLHGESPLWPDQQLGLAAFARLLHAFCDEMGLDEVDLVANDTGGAIAQIFAARRPERIRSIALTNCETHDNVPPPAFKSTIRLARAGILKHTAPRLTRSPERARRRVFGFERWLCSLDPQDLVAIEPHLRRLDVPPLIVWGTGDRFFDVKWAYWLAERLPRARGVVELENARLFFPDERGEELAQLLLDHWETE